MRGRIWGEGGGGIGISAFRSNRFALWLLSNSIFCQLASRTPTLEKKTRTTRAIYTLHSITHVSARAKGAHIDSHTVTNMARKLLCVFFLHFFFCVLFLHFIWPAFNWHLSREIFWYNASAFVCTVRVQSLDSLPLRTQTQIRIGATSQPRKSTFPPFSSYLSKEAGGGGIGI